MTESVTGERKKSRRKISSVRNESSSSMSLDLPSIVMTSDEQQPTTSLSVRITPSNSPLPSPGKILFYRDGILNPINESLFDKTNVPFCFKCCKESPPYAATIEKTGFKVGNFDGKGVREWPLYREIYVCEACFDTIKTMRSNSLTLPIVNIDYDARMLYTECKTPK